MSENAAQRPDLDRRFVVVGAGQAGAHLATSLIQFGWTGPISVVGSEPQPPYQRPPLSKAYLSGTAGVGDILIRPEAAYADHGIDLHLGRTAKRIDRAAHLIELDDGRLLPYDVLGLCTGSRPRPLPVPGAQLTGVHYMRTIRDADEIRASAGQARHAVVVGGGYTGLEVASVLVQSGLRVTVLEAADRLLARVAGVPISAFYRRLHTERGVEIRTNAAVTEIAGSAKVTGVTLADGERLPADLVIVAVGIMPNVELAQQAGLDVDNGIVVDEDCRTSDPSILAAGDCTNRWDPIFARSIRHESVPNAMEQARAAAATSCGTSIKFAEPWFWSDQYDVKLQIAGLSHGHDSVVFRGDIDHGASFVAWYFRDGQLIAADCVNRPKEFLVARRLLGARLSLTPATLEDENTNLAAELKAMVAS